MNTNPSKRVRPGMPACSICLRTQLRGEWLEAEEVIRELRTHQQATPPRLLPALCDTCEETIARRRSNTDALDRLAA